MRLDLHGVLVVFDEVGGDVMLVEIFAAVSAVSGFHIVVSSEPLDNRLSHVHSSESQQYIHSPHLYRAMHCSANRGLAIASFHMSIVRPSVRL